MATATIHFFGNLNDFLPPDQKGRALVFPLIEPTAVKHPIEALGVPHPEVDAILVNREPVDFAYRLADADQVDVFSAGDVPPLSNPVLLRPPLQPPLQFVLDTHLGLLASYLRLLGFDAVYRNDFDDPELAELAAGERRVLLTRDRGLLKRKIVIYGYCVRESDPRRQIVSVVRRYGLSALARPWQRCLRCNGLLEPVAKATILDRLEPKTRLYYDDFQRCRACDRIFWQGSHFARLQEILKSATRDE